MNVYSPCCLPRPRNRKRRNLSCSLHVGFHHQLLVQQRSKAIYGEGAGVVFLGYFFFEIPGNFQLQKIGAHKTLMRITIGWGTVCVGTMFVTTPIQFYVVRFLLGAFEAGFQPGVLIYLSYWYPTHHRAQASGLFTSATAVSPISGGPIAGYLVTGLAGAEGLAGWQWVFLLEACVAALAGAAAW